MAWDAPAALLHLQRTAGNAFVSKLLSLNKLDRVVPPLPSSAIARQGLVQRTLSFPIPPERNIDLVEQNLLEYIASVNEELGGKPDPQINVIRKPWFGSPRVEVEYTAQQLIDQYPKFTDYLNIDGPIVDMVQVNETALHKSGVPRVLAETYGSLTDKWGSSSNETEHKGLMQGAIKTAHTFNFGPVDATLRSRIANNGYQAQLAQSPDSVTGVLSILDQEAEGVLIGENHTESDNRKLLIDLVPELGQHQVTTIYLEALRADYQSLVDKYLNGPPQVEMPAQLYRFLKAKGEGNHSYLSVIQAIKAQGGLVVKSIDSLPATSRPYGGDVTDRDIARELAMNEYAKNTILADRTRRNGSKYIVLAGKAHSNTQPRRDNHVGLNTSVPGLSQLLNVPAVHAPQSGLPGLDEENVANR